MTAVVQDAIVLFGDSITQGSFEPSVNGIGQRLSHVYARQLDVVNRGLSGYNTEWALPVFNQCFATVEEQKHLPVVQLLVIWFGANDACIKPSPQHVPLDKFIENLTYFIEAIVSPTSPRYSPETRIVLITPPPINSIHRAADLISRDPPLELDRLFDTTRLYADGVRDLAAKYVNKNVALSDVFTGIWEAAGQDEASLSTFLADGLHLNEAGYQIAYDRLMETIRTRYPDVFPEKLQFVFAPWSEVEWKNPEKLQESLVKRKANGAGN